MLSKFSVKKPYTVIVGLVLIVVLGIVSFQRMTTDLLPDINLPYAIVITAYPGASPSQVEEAVTKPVEQSMATVSNIKKVQSCLLYTSTISGLEVASILGSTSIIERTFSISGIGSLLVDAVAKNDYPVVQGVTLVIVVLVLSLIHI